nr:ABC transporter substrate-binding protein [Actinokineospora enzanensis]
MTALWTVLAIVLAGCADTGGGRVEIVVATFGEFGYEPLFTEYERLHPDIHLVGRVSDFDSHHRDLITALAVGRGAADVVAVEEQYLPRMRQVKDKFVDLATYGAGDLRPQWAPWKWEQGLAGPTVLGLGTDMGGLAMCYRRDLFAAAGLPTDRDEVAKLWPTWDGYAATADRFAERSPGAKFVDSAGTIYTAIVNQGEQNYFAKADDSFIGDTNPRIRRAFDVAAGLATRKRTAGVTTFTQPWNVAINQGAFATITCPAWMLAQIKQSGGAAGTGNWDVTSIPEGGGNWGGSFLTVPAQGAHPREAYEVARWLTAPEQQKALFLHDAILPSEPAVYHDPAVLGHTDPYFADAPVGRIFAASSDQVRPNYRGLRDADVRPKFGLALGRVEDGTQSVDAAWEQAVREARETLRWPG